MAQVPIHFARMAGLPDEESRRRRSARGIDTVDVTDSAVTDSAVTDSAVTDSAVTDSPLQPDAQPAPAAKPARVRPGGVRLAFRRRRPA